MNTPLMEDILVYSLAVNAVMHSLLILYGLHE